MAWWAWGLRFLGIGWYVAFCIVAGILGGVWLDRRLGSLPLFTLVGVVLGVVLAFWGVYRMVQPLLRGDGEQGNRVRRREKE